MDDWRRRIERLGFRPTEYGGMRGTFEGISITATQHPLKGLCLSGNYFNGQKASDVELFIPVDSGRRSMARAVLEIHRLVYPNSMQ